MMDSPPESCENGRRIGNVNINETVTMHHRGSRVLHEMRGRNNFGIINVMDEHGNSRPEGIIKMMKVWFNDGQSRFELEVNGKDFWFRTPQCAKGFVGEKESIRNTRRGQKK